MALLLPSSGTSHSELCYRRPGRMVYNATLLRLPWPILTAAMKPGWGNVFREDVLRIKNDIQEAFAMHRTAIVEEFRIVRADDKTLRRMERRGTTSLRQ